MTCQHDSAIFPTVKDRFYNGEESPSAADKQTRETRPLDSSWEARYVPGEFKVNSPQRRIQLQSSPGDEFAWGRPSIFQLGKIWAAIE